MMTNQDVTINQNKFNAARILVVDDEEDILELVRHNLAREGYRVDCAETGTKALADAQSLMPDLMILDLMLPDIDGFNICKKLKAAPETLNLPIIMLTARTEESDMVAGLECGADDYITKPFSPRVLIARVRALLRKKLLLDSASQSGISYGDLWIDPPRHEVRIGESRLDLTLTEYRILLALIRRPGWVLTRQQIVDAARGEFVAVTPRSVDVHIVRLRKKLGHVGDSIETIRGIGYRFRRIVID
jgi:two-component system, OmpR family, alkaline phosphatase synthesis response regulator PhoP